MGCELIKAPQGNTIAGIEPRNKDITTYDFGGTQGIKDVLPEFLLLPESMQDVMQSAFQFRYFHDMCDEYYNEGYCDHRTLYGLPYDFRLVLDKSYRENLFRDMKHVIDKAAKTTKTKCVIVTHSLGGIIFKWFLSSYVDSKWIDDHIDIMFMLSPPFGGSLFSLKTVLVGDFYIPQFHNLYKTELQTNAGIVMCIPNELGFDRHQPMIEVEEPHPHFLTLEDYPVLYKEDHPSFKLWYDLYVPYMSEICSYIKVDCHIINAECKATPHKYKIRKQGAYPHAEAHGRGDGIILPVKPGVYNSMFEDKRLLITTLDDCKHTDIIAHPFVIKNVLERALRP